jgi:hypothetical protein
VCAPFLQTQLLIIDDGKNLKGLLLLLLLEILRYFFCYFWKINSLNYFF